MQMGAAIALGDVILLTTWAEFSRIAPAGLLTTPNGAVSTSAQNPVPLLYGRMIVGSAVISAGIFAEDRYDAAGTIQPTGAPSGASISGAGRGRNLPVVGFGGGKSGGGAQSTSRGQSHGTAYAHIIDLITERQGRMAARRSDAGRDTYLDRTPVANEDGTLNVQNVIDFRTGTRPRPSARISSLRNHSRRER